MTEPRGLGVQSVPRVLILSAPYGAGHTRAAEAVARALADEGARVEILAGGRRQVREVRTDGSYLSAHQPAVHFGLGAAGEAEEVRIRWPSGRRQTLTHVSGNQLLKVREPEPS